MVLLTAYGEFEYARQAVQLGVDYYLIKDEVDAEYMKERLLALTETVFVPIFLEPFIVSTVNVKVPLVAFGI